MTLKPFEAFAESTILGKYTPPAPTKQDHRASRIEMYADWLQHDADGLTFNLTMPRVAECTAVTLATARAKLTAALELIDNAIAVDRAANAEKESA
jgi:hypothetical protein